MGPLQRSLPRERTVCIMLATARIDAPLGSYVVARAASVVAYAVVIGSWIQFIPISRPKTTARCIIGAPEYDTD